MLLKRAVSVGTLAVVGVALLLIPARWASAQRASDTRVVAPAPDPSTLLLRRPLPKRATEELSIPTAATGRIIVKFNDQVRARVQAGVLNAQGAVNVEPARVIMNQFGLTAAPLFKWNPQRLANLQNKAANVSGKAQPDLAGMITFEGPWDNLRDAARALNNLPSVEWVDFEQQWRPMGTVRRCCDPITGACSDVTPAVCVGIGGIPGLAGTSCADGACGPGGCCIDADNSCEDAFDEDDCVNNRMGTYQGFGTACSDPIDCGPPPNERRCCFPDVGNCEMLTVTICAASGGTPGSVGEDCSLRCGPGACCITGNCTVTFDEEDCMGQGGIYLGFDPGPDPCEDVDCDAAQCGEGNDSCFTVHPMPACQDQDCCDLVCALLPNCCDTMIGTWTQFCVDLADLFCSSPACPGTPVGNCPDRCASPFNGDCFTPHTTGGCIDEACCNLVCALDPFCCALVGGFWDASCVNLAQVNCAGASGSGPTPDFTNLQGYLRESNYNQQAGGAPPFTNPTGGGGWNLRGDNYAQWVINEINVVPDPTVGDSNLDGVVSGPCNPALPCPPGTQDQFIEIVNNHDNDRAMGDFTIVVSDTVSMTTTTVHTFSGGPGGSVVRAGEAIVVFDTIAPGMVGDPTFGGSTVQTASTGALNLFVPIILDQDFGTIQLRDNNGRLVTSYTYGVEATKRSSITRKPDVSGPDNFSGGGAGLTPLNQCSDDIQCAPGTCFGNSLPGVFDGACTPGTATPGRRSDGTVFSFDKYLGLYGTSRELIEVFGVGETMPPGTNNFDNLVYNSRGKGINVGVIEWAFYQNHEDLSVIVEPGQTLLPIPENVPDHATACLGIINGQENSFGVTGIAPEAQAWFFPLISVEEGTRDLAAFLSAYEMLNAGDVVSCSFGPGDPFWNLNNQPATWTLMRMGSDLGITTCLSAGNDCENLSQVNNLGDSGAIVVGAGQPAEPWCRLTFSNYYQNGDFNDDGNVVHVQAWGSNVTTTGYGLLYNPGGDNNRTYTSGFNGTSASAPQVAGLVACLQGLAKQVYGIHLGPPDIRASLASYGSRDQCLIEDTDDLPGFPAIVPCGPDTDPDSGPNRIGKYPVPGRNAGSASWGVLNNSSFDQSPLVDDLVVITGDLVQGNVFSVKGSDDNYLVIESVPANGTGNGTGGHDGGIVVGDSTMFQLIGHMQSTGIESLQVAVESFVDNGSGIQLVYLFDWNINSWIAIGMQFLTVNDPDIGIVFPVENGSRFVRNSDARVMIRVQSVALGVGGQHRSFTDWVDLNRGLGDALLSGGP